ncbi:hypothetical protein FRC04_009675 [Tulasnella sp. 424]|nr:hypothetical protein FRC04_009675 [Tulasnella sp. 424]
MTAEFEVQRAFLSSPEFAVVGASKDESKIGSKLLRWYKDHDKIVTPLHPKEEELGGLRTLRKLSELSSPMTTSLSIVTPPKVTLGILRDASELKIPYIWIQPGAEDQAVVDLIESNDHLKARTVYGGPCVLASGDNILSKL